MTDDELELRLVLPRGALPMAGPAARTEYFSQHNAEELLGIPRRQFLELLRREDAPPVVALGKLRMVEREPMLTFLRTLRRRGAEPTGRAAEELDGPDRVLREIGCAPARGRRVG